MTITPKPFFENLFRAAVAAADPRQALPAFLPSRPKGRTIVVGTGKGAAQMAQAFEEAWDGPLEGAVVTRYGYGAPTQRIKVFEAAHPVPDAAGLEGSRHILRLVSNLTEDDLVVALICGGGSALLPAPPPGMALEDEIAVNEALLASGAPISAMNMVRKHLSTIKGGRLALAAYPAHVVSLIVSDIPGDDPALVSSGPTVPDTATRQDAMAVVKAYGIRLPAAAIRHIHSHLADAPKPDDPRFASNEVHIVASAARSLEAVAAAAEKEGVKTVILSDAIEGEAREVGRVHAAIAREVALRDRPFQKPVLMLSGGETTVTIRERGGRGGRNTEFLLSLALGIENLTGITAFAADTDGIDGSENNAGAFADHTTVSRLRQAGFDPKALLAAHDSWGAFNALGDLFMPGPTGTNVNDLRAVLVR